MLKTNMPVFFKKNFQSKLNLLNITDEWWEERKFVKKIFKISTMVKEYKNQKKAILEILQR